MQPPQLLPVEPIVATLEVSSTRCRCCLRGGRAHAVFGNGSSRKEQLCLLFFVLPTRQMLGSWVRLGVVMYRRKAIPFSSSLSFTLPVEAWVLIIFVAEAPQLLGVPLVS